LLAGASGTALEVGAGDGINLQHDPAIVAELIAVEPDPRLRTQAERAANRLSWRSGGGLRFYEHVRCHRPAVARRQRLIDAGWAGAIGGCHTNRDTLPAIAGAGFRPERRDAPFARSGSLALVCPALARRVDFRRCVLV
jgi:hypothetical protein